jgi:hypothetical protein
MDEPKPWSAALWASMHKAFLFGCGAVVDLAVLTAGLAAILKP